MNYILSDDFFPKNALGNFWLFNIQNGDSFELSESAFFVLDSIKNKQSISQIVRYIAEKENASVALVEKKVQEFIDYFLDLKVLIEVL